MDLIYGMVSMVKDISSSDRQFRSLNFQLKYTLQKAHLILKKVASDDPNIAFMIQNLYHRVAQGEGIAKRLDELLNAESIAIQDKIRLSLPFNQTKTEVTTIIDTLEKAITDLKEELPDDDKAQQRNGPLKRPLPIENNDRLNESRGPSNQEIDERIEQIYEMGPTINDDELVFSQSKARENEAEFFVEVKGDPEIVKLLQKEYPDLQLTRKKVSSQQRLEELTLYTVARLNFQKCYNKLKNLTKDIDRISTKAHFHFVLKKVESPSANLLQVPQAVQKQASSVKKKRESLGSNGKEGKQEEDVFFSFPQEDKAEPFQNMRILMRKEDSKKAVYRLHMGEWVKVEEEEIEVGNGERLAVFVGAESQEPAIYFQLRYGVAGV